MLIGLAITLSLSAIVAKAENVFRFQTNYTIPRDSFIQLEKTSVPDIETSEDSGDVYGSYEITSQVGNGTFDVFMFDMTDVDDMICYHKALEDQNFSSDACEFLNKTSTILSKNNFTLMFDRVKLDYLSLENKIVVLDNTRFPHDGAYADDDLFINSTYTFTIHPSNTFYNWTLGLGISLGVTIVILVIVFSVLLYKYKKLREKNMKYVLMTGDKKKNIDLPGRDREWAKQDRSKTRELFFNEGHKSKEMNTSGILPKRKYFD